jgi:ABC-type transporter Mla subunit MlaD
MARRKRIVKQPPIDRNARAGEAREAWPGVVVLLLGAALLLGGLWLPTPARTRDGERATERQLTRAFRSGGVQHEDPTDASGADVTGVASTDDTDDAGPAPDTKVDLPKIIIDQNADDDCPT